MRMHFLYGTTYQNWKASLVKDGSKTANKLWEAIHFLIVAADSQLTCIVVFSGTVSHLGKSCAHEAQCTRDSVADLAHTVPPVAREPTFRQIALHRGRIPKTTAVSGDALFSTLKPHLGPSARDQQCCRRKCRRVGEPSTPVVRRTRRGCVLAPPSGRLAPPGGRFWPPNMLAMRT
jgi:hypothetical protein